MATGTLRSEFVKNRERQAQCYHGRSITKFEAEVGDVMLAIAEHVMTDRRPMMPPFTAPTGAGKSTSAAALAVAGWRADPDFSCAFVVETIRGCQETLDLVLDLLTPEELEARHQGPAEIAIWTTAHAAEKLSDDEERAERWLRQVEDDYKVQPTEFHTKRDRDRPDHHRLTSNAHRRDGQADRAAPRQPGLPWNPLPVDISKPGVPSGRRVELGQAHPPTDVLRRGGRGRWRR